MVGRMDGKVPKRRGSGLGVCVGRWGGWGEKCGSWLGMGTDGFKDRMPVKKDNLGAV
jgi:hypothetical protein